MLPYIKLGDDVMFCYTMLSLTMLYYSFSFTPHFIVYCMINSPLNPKPQAPQGLPAGWTGGSGRESTGPVGGIVGCSSLGVSRFYGLGFRIYGLRFRV